MTGFEGRVLEATSALLQNEPELTANAGLNLGEPYYQQYMTCKEEPALACNLSCQEKV